MPIAKRVKRKHPPESAALCEELVAEWREAGGDPSAPTIVEEHGSNEAVHLYVLWDKWGDLSYQERGAIILDAYKELHDGESSALLKVTVALGVTTTEAARMGLEIE
jgi:hypothetical protein